MAVQLGKRYKDEQTGIELLVIKPGNCELKIDGREMELMQPKVLPSAGNPSGPPARTRLAGLPAPARSARGPCRGSERGARSRSCTWSR